MNGLLMNDLQHDKTGVTAFPRSSNLSYLANGPEPSCDNVNFQNALNETSSP